MSDSDSEKNKNQIILLHIDSKQAVAKHNPWRLRGALLLMLVIVMAGFWLIPSQSFLDSYPKISASEANTVLSSQTLNAEVASLKGELVGIVSGSIENKLVTLEQSLRNGSTNASLGAIQDLKNDIKLLRTYSTSEKAGVQSATANAQLVSEMAHLKRLIYMTIGSCGLMFVAIAGIWIKNTKTLPYPEKLVRFLGKL